VEISAAKDTVKYYSNQNKHWKMIEINRWKTRCMKQGIKQDFIAEERTVIFYFSAMQGLFSAPYLLRNPLLY